jgi:site-specific DNA-methyltransferase (adenine-specific)
MSLPKPYYEHAGITIYHADCRDILSGIEYDSIVTDPPYGVGKNYGQCVDDLAAFQDAVRLVSSSRAAVFVPVCRIWDLPVRPQWMAIWSKAYGASGLLAYPIYPHWEGIALYNLSGNFKGNCGHRSDVFHFAPAVANGSGHPTPKPLNLIRELVSWMPGQAILDPFMGSGTTLVAAKQLGRRAIGIEIEERYCEIAASRLSQEVLEFAPAAPVVQEEQAELFADR